VWGNPSQWLLPLNSTAKELGIARSPVTDFKGENMSIHHVKSWPHQFAAVSGGYKTAELRKNDREYNIGDVMVLHEYDPATGVYSGRTADVEITHKLDKDNLCAVSKLALSDEYAVLSVKLIKEIDDITSSAPIE
jgi:hypothetical protein